MPYFVAIFWFIFVFPQSLFADSKKIANCIRNPECHRIFIVAHRANGFDAPENSRKAVRHAIEAGVPIIEIDIQKSRDGYLYVMHDITLNRTTSSQGKIREKLSIELENVFLENGETPPMLQDLYDISNGKALLNLDFKVNAVKEVAEWINRNGSFNDFIFFVDNKAEMVSAAEMKLEYPEMIVMAREKNNISLEKIEKIFGEQLPEIVHTDFPREEDVLRIQTLGKKIWANSIRPEKRIWPINAIAKYFLVIWGVDFIQTDEPLAWLKELKQNYRRTEKKHNFGVVYENTLFRSKAPSKEFLEYLRNIRGLKVIVDFRNPNSLNEGWRIEQEKEWAKELGLKYVSFPVISSRTFRAANLIKEMLKEADGSILIHCQAGKDRTGAVVAFLRMQDGWSYEEAVREMKKYRHNPKKHEIFNKHLRAFTNKMGVLGIDTE